MRYQIEFEQEVHGRWIAEMPDLRGVMAYGVSKSEAESKVEAMALGIIGTVWSRRTQRSPASPPP